MSVLVAIAAAVAGLPAGTFDCRIADAAIVSVEGGQAKASPIGGFPSDGRTFRMTIAGDEVQLDWPNSPISASGKTMALQTAPGAGAALFVSSGPCLFTEANCASMVNFVQQPDKSLRLLISPTALSRDTDKDVRFPFLVHMEGRCVPGDSRK